MTTWYASRCVDSVPKCGCGECHDRYGNTLNLVSAIFTPCDCPSLDGISYNVISSSVTGAFAATWNGTTEWDTPMGILTVQFYSDICVTPQFVPQEFGVSAVITCLNNLFTIRVNADAGLGSPLLFGNSTPQPLGIILNDMAVCDGFTPGFISSITLTAP